MIGGRPFFHYPAKRKNRVRDWQHALILFLLAVPAFHALQLTSGKTETHARPLSVEAAEVASNRAQLFEAATKAFAEAEQLKLALEPSARLAAIFKYTEARRLWESAGEYGKAAEALCNAGNVYFSLSQYREALSQYQASLAIAQGAGNQLVRTHRLEWHRVHACKSRRQRSGSS